MGVGAGVGFAGEAEACWLGAVPPLETKARIRSKKTIRTSECMERKLKLFCRWSKPVLLAVGGEGGVGENFNNVP
jgi:dissimilatory sulfite reductase (desulfoviridin) alpha/beta subunit